MIDTSRPFWKRTGPAVVYPGLTQGGEPLCVYASIGGAINHLAGRTVWQTKTLQKACAQRGVAQPTFDCVIPVAIEPVASELAYEVPRESIKADLDKYIGVVDECVTRGGVAIVSLEVSRTPPPRVERVQRYHMVSLIRRVHDGYRIWDTNGWGGFLTDKELRTGFLCPPLTLDRVGHLPTPYLVLHPEHDCILLRQG